MSGADDMISMADARMLSNIEGLCDKSRMNRSLSCLSLFLSLGGDGSMSGQDDSTNQ